MKFYQVKKLENKLSNELSILNNRFINNNLVVINNSRDYDSKLVLDEIKLKYEELLNIRFLIRKYELNIYEIIIQNEEYKSIIELLNKTPTSNDVNYENTFTRLELDLIIKEYQNKIEQNQETLDYYYFTTDVEI